MAMERPNYQRPPTTHTTKVGNWVRGEGNVIVEGIDGRTHHGRRLKEITNGLLDDMGGDPTHAEKIVIVRAAHLVIWCEQQEVAMATGGKFDLGGYTAACSSLDRLLNRVGYHRRQKDVTSFADYLEGKATDAS